MKQFIYGLMLLVVATALSFGASQPKPEKGVAGVEAHKAKVVRFTDMPEYTPDQNGPIIHTGPELAAPFSPIVPPVDISQLKNVTIDKTLQNIKARMVDAPAVGGVNFEGITQGGYIPGEPTVAAGPLNVLTVGNSSVTVTNKDGSNRVEINGLTFFGAPSSEVAISDGLCMYDARRGHFIACCFTTDVTSYSHMYFAISVTNDARGAWYQYVSDFRKDGNTTTNNFADYQEFGISDDKFVISSQQFSLGATNTYQYQKLRVWDINQVMAGTASTYVDFNNFSGQKFVTKPGRNLGNTVDSTIYLLATNNNGGTILTYGSITGTAASPTLSFGTQITVQTYSTVVNAAQPTGTVVAGDDRTFNFVVRNKILYEIGQFSLANGGTVDALRLWKIDVSNRTSPSLLTDETFTASGIHMYYPSITVDSVGSIYIGFDRSSSSEFSSGWVTGKRRSDATIQSSIQVKAGLTSTTSTRWGDYTGADMDESASGPGGSTAWTATQWVKAASTFGTWINQLTFPYNQISGKVQLDGDGNSGTSGDRLALSGWTVTLKQGASTIGTTTSDASGNYSFGYLENGTYNVILTQQGGGYAALDVVPGSGGTTQTKVDSLTIQVVATMGTSTGQTSTGNNFLQMNSNASISGTLYYDINGNGAKDAGEPGLSGWTINLGGDATSSTTTDANGAYQFQNLSAGNFTVSEVLQTGYTQSAPVGGTYSINLPSGTTQSASNDFGNFGKIWTGGASTTLWGDAANWNPSGAPNNTNDIYLPSSATIDINVAAQAKSLNIQNSGVTLTVKSGNSLAITGNLSMTAGTLNTEAAFPTVGGTSSLTGGTVGYTALSGSQTVAAKTYGTLIISGGGTKTLAGGITLSTAMTVSGGTLNLAGMSLTLTGGTIPVTVSNGATLQTGGTAIYNLSNVILGSSSTVEYSGAAETILPGSGISGGAYGNLTIGGTGTKTSAVAVNVNGVLALNQILNTGGNLLTLGGSGSVTRSTGQVVGPFGKTVSGSGTVTWEVGNGTDYLPISMNISALSGSGVITQTLSNSNPATSFVGTSSKAIGHYYTITIGSGLSSVTAAPILSFTETEFNALTGTGGDQTKLFLARWNTGAWSSFRTSSTLQTTASGATLGAVTLTSGVSSFSPWAIFWGTDDTPLAPPTSFTLKTWVGAGAAGGSTGTDFNAAANWSPATVPTASDSCRIIETSASSITLSGSATVGALVMGLSGGSGKVSSLSAGTNALTVISTTTITNAGGTGASTNQIQLNIGNGGSMVFNGNFSSTGATNASIVIPLGIGATSGTMVFKGNVTLGTNNFTSAANNIATVIFDAPVAQTISSTSGSTVLWGNSSTEIGSINNPTVTIAGTTARQIVVGNLNINGTSTLDLGTVSLNRNAAGGSINIASGAKLRLSGTTGGQTGSNFPSNFTSFNFNAGSTQEYYGASAQTIYGGPSYGTLNLTQTTPRTTTLGGALTVQRDLTIGAGVTLDASASNFAINVGGNWTRTGSFTPRTGTVTFNGSSAQTISPTNTFSGLTINNAAGVTMSAADTVGGTLTLTSGNFNVGANTLTLNGPAIAGTPTNLITTSSSSVVFGGSSASVALPSSASALTNLTVNNTNGVTLSGNTTVSGTTALTNGAVTTGANTLTANGSVTRTSGYVNGNLKKPIATGAGVSKTFEIGGATGYRPATVSFGNVSTGGTLTASSSSASGNHPNLGSSTIDPTKSVTRYWTLTNNGIAFDNYSATLNFLTSDYTAPPAVPASFVIEKYDGANWLKATTGSQSTTSAQATGLTSFSDFAVGNVVQRTISASAGAHGTITPSGSVLVDDGGSQSFTIAGSTGYHIQDVLVDGGSVGAVTSYNFTNVTSNHTIAASFAPDTFIITATAHANGSISPSGAVQVAYSANQSFTASPNSGYHVDSLVVDGVNAGAGPGYTFSNVTTAHTIDAYFGVDAFTITASAGSNGSISPSGAVSVNNGADQTFNFTPSTGYHVDSVIVDGSSQTVASSYTFTGVNASHTIRVTFAIDRFTVTATAGSNGSISPSGSVSVNYGANQAFTITPATGYHVDSVVVDGASIGAQTSYTFTNVTANHSIAAYFAIDQFTITSSAGSNGSISPSGATSVSYGGSQAYTFTPATGYRVDSIFIDGVGQAGAPSYTFSNVQAAHTIHVTFTVLQYTITATSGAGGTVAPAGVTTVSYGGSQSYTITTDAGYHITDVVVDGNSVGAVSSYDFTNVTGNHTISASFSITGYTLTATAIGHGTISPAGSIDIDYGHDTTFTITPETGYHVDSVRVDGANVGAVTTHTFTNVQASHTITAYFSVNVVTITATAGSNGSISPAGSVGVNYGSNQTFTFTPATGYHVDSVYVDGSSVAAAGTYDFTTVIAPHTIHVTFAINSFTIVASAGAHGSISPSGNTGVSYGANQTFTFAPATGYHVDSIYVDGLSQAVASSYQFTNVTAGHSISVTFAIDQFTISASAGAHGSISPSGSTGVSYGGNQSYTFSPATGYHADSVYIDGVGQAAGANYSFSNVTANHTISVTFAINNYTVSASAGSNGSISPGGNVSVSFSANQTFSFTANTGYHVDSLIVDGVNQAAAASYQFTNVQTNHTIRVTFAINQYTITSLAGTNGAIAPSGSTGVAYGGSQNYTFTPNSGYHVDSVLVDGASQGAAPSYQFTNVTANHTIRVTFAINVYAITSSAGLNGSISPSGSTNVTFGSSQTFTFTPSTGYHVDSVIVDGVNQASAASYQFTNVQAGHSIRVTFAINTFTITASSGSNGTIAPTGAVSVNFGANQSFTFTPSTGYHTDSVIVDGASQAVAGTYQFTNVQANHTIRVVYKINSYTITATSGTGGSITPSGAVSVTYGGNQSFAFTPSTGYHIDSIIVDGASQSLAASYGFTNVTTNHTIRVTFAIDQFTINATSGAHGSIAPSGNVSVAYGANQAFTFTPASGYHVDSLIVDGANQAAAASYSFTNVTAGHTIRVTFSIDNFTITASAGSNGTISPSGTVLVSYGADTTFTFTPSAGYAADSLFIDGVGQGLAPATTHYTLTGVTANHTVSVTFKLMPSYSVRYRTFTYDSLIVNKAVKKKAVSDYAEFTIVNTTTGALSQINASFSAALSQIVSSSPLTSTGAKKDWTFNGTLNAGDSVVLKVRSKTAKPMTIAKLWFGIKTKTATMVNVAPSLNKVELPMPNAANVRNDLWTNALSAQGGLVVGIAKVDTPSSYGWVKLKKAADLYKSFIDKTGLHTHINNGFVSFTGGKKFVKAQGSLPPAKQDNKTFADLATLKVNIALSALGMTQRGLGELMYTEAGNPFAGMLVRDLAVAGDSMMTMARWPVYSTHPELYGQLDTALMHINSAFSGALDTVSWSDTLRLTGTKKVIDAGILTPTSVAAAVMAYQYDASAANDELVPQTAQLYQNYPNPFNPMTELRFDLPVDMQVTVKIYNLLGQEVAQLADNEPMEAGVHEVAFDASKLASGVYFYRLTAQGTDEEGLRISYTDAKKMMLIK